MSSNLELAERLDWTGIDYPCPYHDATLYPAEFQLRHRPCRGLLSFMKGKSEMESISYSVIK